MVSATEKRWIVKNTRLEQVHGPSSFCEANTYILEHSSEGLLLVEHKPGADVFRNLRLFATT